MNPTEAVLKLLSRGWTQQGIANAVSLSQPTIHRIKAGTMSPRYEAARELEKLVNNSRRIPR